MKKLHIALVCMPWNDVSNPSIQLGSMMSFTKKRLPEVHINTFNIHLNIAKSIGLDLYKKIRGRCLFFVESLYAKLLYPELELFYDSENAKEIFDSRKSMEEFLYRLEDIQKKIFDRINWNRYDFVVFPGEQCRTPLQIGRTMSSLYMIKKIKEKFPKIKILLIGEIKKSYAKSLIQQFKEIDIAVSGEGELNFYHILKSELEENEDYKKLPGIIYRENGKVIANKGFNQLKNLNDLEIPDYSDYFRDMEKLNIDKNNVAIPIELSRGCYHDKCSFCALNKVWNGYRMKSTEKLIKEIKYFKEKYDVNKFILCDTMLPEEKIIEISEKIKRFNKEAKSKIKIMSVQSTPISKLSTFEKIRRSPIKGFVFGIDSLSSSLLKKMNKPNNLIKNIQCIKMSKLYNIQFLFPLLYNYPATEEEINETLKNLKLIKHLSIPELMFLRVQLESEIYKNPEKYGIKIYGNEYNYKYLFPESIRKKLDLEYKDYSIDKKIEEKWKEVKEKIREMKREYEILESRSKLPILYHFKNDKNLLVVVRRTLNGEIVYKLNKIESKIYEFCDTSKLWKEIESEFKDIKKSELRNIVDELKKKGLFFESDEKVLSLSLDLKKYYKNRN